VILIKEEMHLRKENLDTQATQLASFHKKIIHSTKNFIKRKVLIDKRKEMFCQRNSIQFLEAKI